MSKNLCIIFRCLRISVLFLFLIIVSADKIYANTVPELKQIESENQGFERYDGPIKNVIKSETLGTKDKINQLTKEYIVVERLNPDGLEIENKTFKLTDKTLIFNKEVLGKLSFAEIKEGLNVTVFYKDTTQNSENNLSDVDLNINATIIIIDDRYNKDVATHLKLDKNLISQDGAFSIKINEDTSIVNEQGQLVSTDDLIGKNLIVFHSQKGSAKFTRQLDTSKIILLDSFDINVYEENIVNKKTNSCKTMVFDLNCLSYEEIKTIEELEKDDFSTYSVRVSGEIVNLSNQIYSLKDNKMLPIREVFEQLGHKVIWESHKKAIEVKKGDRVFYIPQVDLNGNSRIFTKNNISYISHKYFEDYLSMSIDFNF